MSSPSCLGLYRDDSFIALPVAPEAWGINPKPCSVPVVGLCIFGGCVLLCGSVLGFFGLYGMMWAETRALRLYWLCANLVQATSCLAVAASLAGVQDNFFHWWLPFDLASVAFLCLGKWLTWDLVKRMQDSFSLRGFLGPAGLWLFVVLQTVSVSAIVGADLVTASAEDIPTRMMGWRIHCAGWSLEALMFVLFSTSMLHLFRVKARRAAQLADGRAESPLLARLDHLILWCLASLLVPVFFAMLAAFLPAYWFLMLLLCLLMQLNCASAGYLFTSAERRAALRSKLLTFMGIRYAHWALVHVNSRMKSFLSQGAEDEMVLANEAAKATVMPSSLQSLQVESSIVSYVIDDRDANSPDDLLATGDDWRRKVQRQQLSATATQPKAHLAKRLGPGPQATEAAA
jgi:hypothetical protein